MSNEPDLKKIKEAVLKSSNISSENTSKNDLPFMKTEVRGYDFNNGINYDELLKTYIQTGFQATHFGLVVEQINTMVSFVYPFLMFCLN